MIGQKIPSKDELLALFESSDSWHPIHSHRYLGELFDDAMNDRDRVLSALRSALRLL